MRLRLICVALLIAAPLTAQTATEVLQVSDVRFWTLAGVTRVAIETTGEFHYKSDHIPNPERLFFDIEGAKLKGGSRRIQVKQVNDKLLKRIRIAENIPGVTRIVLDLEDGVAFTASQLSNPDRLIVELRPAGFLPPSVTPITINPPARIPPGINVPAKLPTALTSPSLVVENPATAELNRHRRYWPNLQPPPQTRLLRFSLQPPVPRAASRRMAPVLWFVRLA